MLLLADVAVGSPHLCTFRIEIKVSNFILFSIALLVRRRADDQVPACCAFAEALPPLKLWRHAGSGARPAGSSYGVEGDYYYGIINKYL